MRCDINQLTYLCHQITCNERKKLPENHPLSKRLICFEYSRDVQDIKTYPLLQKEQLFALCWTTSADCTLHTTMCPSPLRFCYQCSYEAGSVTQLHTHDYIELFYVVEGEFQQKILGKTVTFHEGDFCLIDRNCVHQDILLDCSSTVLFLGIANDFFSEIIRESVVDEKILSFLHNALLEHKNIKQYLHFSAETHRNKKLERILYYLLNTLYENMLGSHHICKGLLIQIFNIISTEYTYYLSKEQRTTFNWMLFEEIAGFIKSNAASVTISDLVERFHFQEDYYNRLIKAETGMTYSAYLQKIRLEQSLYLLQTTSKSVEEIAANVGYHNKGFFYQLFQKRYQMTPCEYRRLVQKKCC